MCVPVDVRVETGINLVDLPVDLSQHLRIGGVIPIVLTPHPFKKSDDYPTWCHNCQKDCGPSRHRSLVERAVDFSGGQLAVLVGDSKSLGDSEDRNRARHDSGLPHVHIDQ